MLRNKHYLNAAYAACLLWVCPPVFGASDGLSAESRQEESALQAQQKWWVDGLAKKQQMPSETEKVQPEGVRVVDDDFLLAHPQVLENALREALNGSHADLTASLAALYRRLPDYDKTLYGRAEALAAKLNGMPSETVARYRALHRDDPSDDRVLLDLAAAEFEDFRLKEAAAHFDEAATRDLPRPVADNVARFRKRIDDLTAWQWSGGISPTVNSNANNAAPAYCLNFGAQTACSTTKPIRAKGLSYELNADKLTPLAEHHYLKFRANLSGTSYFFDKQSAYDDAFGRVYLGWQGRDARRVWNVLPFYQAQLAGSDDFDGKRENNRRFAPYMLAHGTGVQVSHLRRFGRGTQLFASLERYRQHYREEARAVRNNGWQDSTYVSLAQNIGASATVFGGWQFARFVPDNQSVRNTVNNAAYNRHAVNVGWIQKWQTLGGLNSRVSASFAHRNYKGRAAFADEGQKNRETSVSLGLSHDKLSYRGITPTLNYEYGRTKSNAPYAERRRRQVYIGADWRF